jgi:DNA-binding response OmpR family regulator/anti-sigma regulatory factor (Ser/Thr protein kinase)
VDIQIDTHSYNEELYFDPDVITTILNNLLSNAMKYTSEGKITLTLQQTIENGNDYTDIIVKDTGTGIESQALPHIFNRYYQAKEGHTVSGSGIGLALVKSLAELHEGSIDVESTLGEGSTFTFRILTQNSYPGALHKEVKEEERNEASSTEKNSTNGQTIILVIEDNEDIRDYISSSLGKEYQVLTASNGKEGLELAQQRIPDIILSDVMMPVMDGFELCRLIKKDVRTSHIPVVLLTAKDSIQDKEEGYRCGADSYITKPFSVKLLISRIHNLQQRRERLAEIITQTSNTEKQENTQEQPQNRIELHTSQNLTRLDEEFLNKLTQIVDENITDKDLNITFLTERMSMTTSTLYRKIKGLTGLSGNEFIRKYRLQKSLKYMVEEGYNISETAYACGFSDSGYFRNCFKQEFGMTPSEYLKQFQRTE